MVKKRVARQTAPAAASALTWKGSDLLGIALLVTSVTCMAPALPDRSVFVARAAYTLAAGALWVLLFGLGRLGYFRQHLLLLIGSLATVGAMLLSAAFSKFPLSNIMDGMGMSMGAITWLALIAVALGAAGVRLDGRIRMWLSLVFVWVLPVAVAGLIQRIGGEPITGPLQNDNYFGLIMLLWLPVSIGLAITSSSRRGRTLWIVAAGLIGVAIVASGAQTATAVLMVEIGAIMALLAPLVWPSYARPLRILGYAIAGVTATGIMSVAISGAWGSDGIQWLPAAVRDGLMTRAYLWNGAARIFWSSPLLGQGPDGYLYAAQAVTLPELMQLEHGTNVLDVISADPHSLYLRALANLGIVGVAALLTMGAGWLRAAARLSYPSPQARGLRISLAIGGAGFLLGAAFAPWTTMLGATPALVLGLSAATLSASEPGKVRVRAMVRWGVAVPIALVLLLGSTSHFVQEQFFHASLSAPNLAQREALIVRARAAAPWDYAMRYLRLRTQGEYVGAIGTDVLAFQKAVDADPLARDYGPFLADFARLSLEDARQRGRQDLTWETRTLDRAATLSPGIPEVWAERLHLAVVSGDRDAIVKALKYAKVRAEPALRYPEYVQLAEAALAQP